MLSSTAWIRATDMRMPVAIDALAGVMSGPAPSSLGLRALEARAQKTASKVPKLSCKEMSSWQES